VNARRVRALVKKEFRQVGRDPGTLGVLLVVPLLLLALFGYAISLDIRNVALGVRDGDRTRMSRDLVSTFIRSGYFTERVEIRDRAAVRGLLDGGTAMVVLDIPRGFGDAIARGEPASVQAIVDGSNGTSASTALGYVQAIAADYSRREAAVQHIRTIPQPPPIDYRPRVLYNPELRSANFLVPGLIVLILVITSVISTALAVVRERETGTMEQIRVSPIRAGELIIGKTLPYVAIAVLATTAVLVVSHILFGVEVLGSYLLLAGVTLLFLVGSLGLGILVSTISDSQQVAFTIAVLVTLLPSFLLSGFVFPIRNMPAAIQAITYVIPTRYYLSALRGIMLKGVGLEAFWRDVVGLGVFALATLAASIVRLSRAGR
jgi:ABC-2 type transport system permease protein